MPKNKLRPFSRRKSSGNVLETADEPARAPSASSFRVLERPEKSSPDGFQRQPLRKPFIAPLHNLRGRSAEELGTHLNRGSGQTTASNSGSSGHYYDSSANSERFSSSSTIPSSFEAEAEPEDDSLFPPRAKSAPMSKAEPVLNEQPQQQPPQQQQQAPVPPPPSFTARAARALSFGSRNSAKAAILGDDKPPVPQIPPTTAPQRSYSPHRDRAMTASSYASTAKPEAGFSLAATDFGGDFGTMFEPTSKMLPPQPGSHPPSPGLGGFHRTDSPPIFPPRAHSRQDFARSSNVPKNSADAQGSPYSFEGTDAYEALLALRQESPHPDDPPAVPAHSSRTASSFMGGSKQGYSLVSGGADSPDPDTNSGAPRGLGVEYRNRQSQLDDEDRWVKRVELRDEQAPRQSSQGVNAVKTRSRQANSVRAPAVYGAAAVDAFEGEDKVGSLWGNDSRNATPRAAGLRVPGRRAQDSTMDSSPTGPPSRAIRPGPSARPGLAGSKTMTKEEFEQLQRSGENSAEHSDEEDEAAASSDEDDEGDRARRMAKQRQKQEANMSVYRQQMKKVTGGGPSDLPNATRPSLDRASQSAPVTALSSGFGSFHLGGIGGAPPTDSVKPKADDDDDDDDVPLGILQAHGFPNSGRPPTRTGENELGHQRRASATGSVLGGGAGQGNLPPFARRLPQDPYFGSSVVNATNRESLGMSTTGGSVYGGAPSVHPGMPSNGSMPSLPTMGSMPQMPTMGHPGGLVGVIAGEERAKAARRGSPNPASGTYGPPPLPQNMPYQAGGMPGMGGRTMSMGNLAAPQVYTPSGNPMMPGMPQMSVMPPMGMPGMGMPQMPMMGNSDQMQQFMAMQMQVMQNMLAMQQQQMGMSPGPQASQAQDYMNAQQQQQQSFGQSFPGSQNLAPPSTGPQGRAMTMMNPPKDWELSQAGAQRPQSAMPAPSISGFNFNLNGSGPAPGYTPSIAPSERSNVGMPSRYRPVTTTGAESGPGSRTHSMTSATVTPSALLSRKSTPEPLSNMGHASRPSGLSSTIRVVDKPKGSPRSSVPVGIANADEEDDEGWAEMKKKRQERTSRFKFGRVKGSKSSEQEEQQSLGELYQGLGD